MNMWTWDINRRRKILVNIVSVTGLSLNDRDSPSSLWLYWKSITGTLLPSQYGYITQETYSYFNRRNGLVTEEYFRLPDIIGAQFVRPQYSSRDHVEAIESSNYWQIKKPWPQSKPFTTHIINPTASVNKLAVESLDVSSMLLKTHDRTYMLPGEGGVGSSRPSGGVGPAIRGLGYPPKLRLESPSVLTMIESLYDVNRAASFGAITPMSVINDGTVEDFEYSFDIDIDG